MASTVGICNRALQELGEERITSLTDDTKAARACSVAYPPLRDAELRRYPWSFALARVTLSPLVAEPEFQFGYQFQLPADFIRLHPDPEYRAETDWRIEGRRLLTNDGDTVRLRYIRRVEDPNEMDVLFREALSTRIAYKLCEELTGSRSLYEALDRSYDEIIQTAKRVDAIEGVSVEIPEDTWVLARR